MSVARAAAIVVAALALAACTGSPDAEQADAPASTPATLAADSGSEPAASTAPSQPDPSREPATEIEADTEALDETEDEGPPASRIETSGGAPVGEVEVGGGAASGDVEARVGEILSEFGAVEVGADTVLTVPEQVLFDFDSAALNPDAAAALDAVVEVLDFEADSPVEVRGHTDSRGADDYNQQLSEARAEAVRAYFEQQGVDPARLRATGLGEAMPVAPNEGPDGADDPAGRQANRRVEVVVEGTAG